MSTEHPHPQAGPARPPGAGRATRQAAAVRDALAGREGFTSAQELHAELRGRGGGVGLTTVYRHLQSLADAGAVDVLRTAEGESVYRLCGSGGHHHHLVCRSCGAVADVDCAVGAAPCLSPSDAAGFVVDEAEVVFWGLCSNCQNQQDIRGGATA